MGEAQDDAGEAEAPRAPPLRPHWSPEPSRGPHMPLPPWPGSPCSGRLRAEARGPENGVGRGRQPCHHRPLQLAGGGRGSSLASFTSWCPGTCGFGFDGRFRGEVRLYKIKEIQESAASSTPPPTLKNGIQKDDDNSDGVAIKATNPLRLTLGMLRHCGKSLAASCNHRSDNAADNTSATF